MKKENENLIKRAVQDEIDDVWKPVRFGIGGGFPAWSGEMGKDIREKKLEIEKEFMSILYPSHKEKENPHIV